MERYLEVDVEAVTPMGDPVRFRAHGWQARILQHEVDHLKVSRVRHPQGQEGNRNRTCDMRSPASAELLS